MVSGFSILALGFWTNNSRLFGIITQLFLYEPKILKNKRNTLEICYEKMLWYVLLQENSINMDFKDNMIVT